MTPDVATAMVQGGSVPAWFSVSGLLALFLLRLIRGELAKGAASWFCRRCPSAR